MGKTLPIWIGLTLLVAGSILAVFPHMPLRPAAGALVGVPNLPWELSWGLVVVGVIVLRWARTRASS